jgi:hypothetical protein
VVESGGECSESGGQLCAEGIIPISTSPLTFWQIQIFDPKVIHIPNFFYPHISPSGHVEKQLS